MSKDRRNFLKTLSALSGMSALEHASLGGLSGLVLAAQKALAQDRIDPKAKFVLFRCHGAMDSTLGLHPWMDSTSGIEENDLFLGYSAENRAVDRIDGTNISLGPAAQAIQPFARNMAIVRGIVVGPNDLGHPFAMQHMTSGRTQEAAPGWTSYIGSRINRLEESSVVTNAPLLKGTLPIYPTLLTSVLRSQIEGVMKASESSPLSIYAKSTELGVQRYLKFLAQKDKLNKFMEVYRQAGKFDQKAFDKALSEGKSLDEAQVVARGAAIADEGVALASLASGISRVAQIDISVDDGKSMDTHASHALNHLPAQKNRWDRIGQFLTDLKRLNMLEDTVVMVMCEFNRTPGLNDNGGKDHNYSDNAVAIFGRNVNGGNTFGSRSLFRRGDGFPYAFWAGAHIDFGVDRNSPGTGKVVDVDRKLWDPKTKTAKVPAGVDLIRPADVWASVINSFQDTPLTSQLPPDARSIPGLFLT